MIEVRDMVREVRKSVPAALFPCEDYKKFDKDWLELFGKLENTLRLCMKLQTITASELYPYSLLSVLTNWHGRLRERESEVFPNVFISWYHIVRWAYENRARKPFKDGVNLTVTEAAIRELIYCIRAEKKVPIPKHLGQLANIRGCPFTV